jgi:23S rRNA (cytosine1962-C5)-methyltransferase
MNSIMLKPGRERSLLRKHPWVFSGAIQRLDGKPSSGETVTVLSADRQFLGYGAWSPESQISVRIWTWDPDEEIGPAFFKAKIEQAARLRDILEIQSQTDAYRLLFSESDSVPGLIADRFGDYVVCQFSSAGAERWKQEIVEALKETVTCKGIYERSDLGIRKKEGLHDSTGLLWGDLPPETVRISENGRLFGVSIAGGHKTGHYLDQRENHNLVQKFASGRTVLDCFSYTGGFSVAAMKGGASHVTLADSSALALAMAGQNAALNGFPESQYTLVEADIFKLLRSYRDDNKTYDLVVLDPPKFVESKNQLDKGARAYKDINMLGIKLLNPGGILFTFSCSGHMEDMLFQKIVADAALDAGREMKIVRWLTQAPDHPVASGFPESKYLKGLMAIAK